MSHGIKSNNNIEGINDDLFIIDEVIENISIDRQKDSSS